MVLSIKSTIFHEVHRTAPEYPQNRDIADRYEDFFSLRQGINTHFLDQFQTRDLGCPVELCGSKQQRIQQEILPLGKKE